MAENEQFTLHNELKDLRKEFETKIDKKLDSAIFWTILGISVTIVIGTSIWFTNMSERITRVETKIEMNKPSTK